MAEKSKSERRYGNPPKGKKSIGPDGDTGMTQQKNKADSATGKVTVDAEGQGAEPKPSVDAGTDGVPVNEIEDRHGRERREIHDRHTTERRKMFGEHQRQYKEMLDRHASEVGAGGTGEGEADKKAEKTAGRKSRYKAQDKGRAGTEP